MRGKDLFEYAVIRVMPRVEREEFLNVGVILYCSAQKFLETKFLIDRERIQAFCKGVDCDELEERLKAFEKISRGGKEAGPIGELPIASRFRWITANRSTVVQTSAVHPGFCDDAGEMLQQLFEKLVM